MFKPLVSIIIPNLNGEKFLEDCLESLREQTCRNFEIILIDNGSTDNFVSRAKKFFPEVKIIKNQENLGFAKANNQGFEISKGEYIATLNNDTVVDRNWLKELVAVAEKDENIGMVASKILLAKEGNKIDSVGVNIALDGMTKQRGGLEIDRGQYDREEEILFPSACAALYKRKMLDEIGFFDEDFFAYCEDSDLGLRGRLAGWKAVYAPKAIVRHLYSQTGGRHSPFKLYLVERNHIWLVIKNFPRELIFLFPLFTFWRFFLQFLAVLIGKGTGSEALKTNSKWVLIKSIFAAHYDGFKKFVFYISQRRQIQKKRKISRKDLRFLFKQHKLSFKNLAFGK